MHASRPGTAPENEDGVDPGIHDDRRIARELYRQELESAAALRSDRRLGQSIAQACAEDGDVVVAFQDQDHQASHDLDAARALAGEPPAPPAEGVHLGPVNDGVIAELAHHNEHQVGEDAIQVGHLCSPLHEMAAMYSKTANAGDDTKGSHASAETVECVSCTTIRPRSRTLTNACGHIYYSRCIRNLFDRATKDEQLFPPRCCRQNILFTAAKTFMSQQLRNKFLDKRREFTTTDRTYCADHTCSAFIWIPKNFVGNRASCTVCFKRTCTLCKAVAHDGPCLPVDNDQELLDVAQNEGWEQCYRCHQMVELSTGCNHMTLPLQGRILLCMRHTMDRSDELHMPTFRRGHATQTSEPARSST